MFSCGDTTLLYFSELSPLSPRPPTSQVVSCLVPGASHPDEKLGEWLRSFASSLFHCVSFFSSKTGYAISRPGVCTSVTGSSAALCRKWSALVLLSAESSMLVRSYRYKPKHVRIIPAPCTGVVELRNQSTATSMTHTLLINDATEYETGDSIESSTKARMFWKK